MRRNDTSEQGVGFYIQEARCAQTLDALFRLRHRVFVEQAGVMPPRPGRRIFDHFDAFPDTVNLIVRQGGEVVGGVRLVSAGPVGIPADQYFDFWPHLPEDARVGSASMFCMDQRLDQRAELTRALVGMFYLQALQRDLSHIVAPINPDMESIVVEHGYEAVGPIQTTSGLVIKPMVLALSRLSSVQRVVGFVQRHHLTHFLGSFDRAFFSAGEHIIRAGTPASEAYVIVSGRVTVRCQSAELSQTICTLEQGELLGELALLTQRMRTADVVADEDCELMVISRQSFERHLQERPDIMAHVLKIVAERLAETTSRL